MINIGTYGRNLLFLMVCMYIRTLALQFLTFIPGNFLPGSLELTESKTCTHLNVQKRTACCPLLRNETVTLTVIEKQNVFTRRQVIPGLEMFAEM